MTNTILELDRHISSLRPDYYPDLNRALTDEEIASLEFKYSITLPADLKQLYKWKNGQKELSFDSFVNNSTFIPLEQALDTARNNTGMIGSDFDIKNWWNEHWIPVFHNGGGDYICYDAGGVFTGEKGQLIEFWHADNDRNVIAPNLQQFLSGLNDYYTATPEDAFDEYFEVAAIKGFPKKFKVK